MSLQSLLNQTITIYNKSNYNAYGRVRTGSGTEVSARFSPKIKRTLLPNGTVEQIDAIAHVLPSVTVDVDDRVDYGTEKYKVLFKYAAPDGAGNTNHIRLALVRWQIT